MVTAPLPVTPPAALKVRVLLLAHVRGAERVMLPVSAPEEPGAPVLTVTWPVAKALVMLLFNTVLVAAAV
jgi:hypothetical protein